MKPREITILAKPGSNAREKIKNIFQGEEYQLEAPGEKRLAYSITKRGVTYTTADTYHVLGLKLDNAHIRLLMYILDHSAWCLRYLIVRTDERK